MEEFVEKIHLISDLFWPIRELKGDNLWKTTFEVDEPEALRSLATVINVYNTFTIEMLPLSWQMLQHVFECKAYQLSEEKETAHTLFILQSRKQKSIFQVI